MRRLKAFLVIAALFGAVWGLHMIVPPQHNRFRSPDLTEPIGLATYSKLTDLKYDTELCLDKLRDAEVEFVVLLADDASAQCPLDNSVTLTKSLTPYNASPLRMTCHQLAALHVWERRVARPQAEKIFNSPLRQIETYGTYSCRNIAGTGTRSQHSYANAIDISAFVLEDGRRISVKDDWRARDKNGQFLKKVHKGACRLFSVTLGPDYNAAHADHFHLDMGSAETCK